MKPTFVFTALASLLHLSHASLMSEDMMIHRSARHSGSLVGNGEILDAFLLSKRHNVTPHQTWTNDKGEVLQKSYIFDEDEWEEMGSHLLARKVGTTPANALMIRQGEHEDSEWLCYGYEDRPWAWTYTLSFVAGTVCQLFAMGAEYTGKKQIIERYDIDATDGSKIKVVFTYTWKTLKWASGIACSTAMSTGINNECNEIMRGKEASSQASQGGKTTYHQDNGDSEAYVAIETRW